MVGSILRSSKMSVYGCEARRRDRIVLLYGGLYDFMRVTINPNAMSLCTLCFDFLVPTLFRLVLTNSRRIHKKFLLLYRLDVGGAGERQWSIGEMAPDISYEIVVYISY